MLNAFCLTVTLTVGQGGIDPNLPPVAPDLPRSIAIPQITPLPSNPARTGVTPSAPGRAVIGIEQSPPARLPAFSTAQPAPTPMTTAEPKKENGNGNGEEKKEDEKEEEKKEEEKYFFMKTLQGTPLGCELEKRRISISGWTQGSFTGSQATTSNSPVTWNDRANKFLLQQNWLKIEKSLDTDSKEMSWGWHIDMLVGTDYRFTLQRGFWNSQLENSQGTQNLYGIDLPQFYLNWYFPNLFEGTEVRVGKMFTPFGYESIEGASSPLLSRSYAFNWSPPFTHMGVMVMPKFSKNLSGKFMIANGNDVFIDPAEELRFVGSLTWTSDDEKDSVTFGTSFGRGKNNVGEAYNPATVGLQTEPGGRCNMNVFDLVWTHKICDKMSYAIEGIYGYQTGVLRGVPGGIAGPVGPAGTAHWGSIVQYLTYEWNDKVSSVLRGEVFDDFEGHRTGFEGLYTAVTLGVQYKPTKWMMVRPEIRYDVNTNTPAFEGGRRSLWTAATDLIVRW